MPQPPHRVRLRRPWTLCIRPDCVEWQRHFGCPTGLEPGDQVWLALESFEGLWTVRLNGHELGVFAPPHSGAMYEVTGQLDDRNDLALANPAADQPDQLLGDDPPGQVYLEIRPVD